MKDPVADAISKQINEAQQNAQPALGASNFQSPTICKCCGWKGKLAQAQKNYFFHAAISELEFFCPKCSTYLGFISDVPDAGSSI
ncbi:MAG: hypothetical protein ABIN57_05890 [Chitinophagaceae bacterium]